MSAEKKIIVQGSDTTIDVKLKTSNGQDYDLTGQTGLTCVFTGGYSVSSVAVVGDATCGNVRVTLTDTDTDSANLEEGSGSMEIVVDKGTQRDIFQLLDVLDIRARIS